MTSTRESNLISKTPRSEQRTGKWTAVPRRTLRTIIKTWQKTPLVCRQQCHCRSWYPTAHQPLIAMKIVKKLFNLQLREKNNAIRDNVIRDERRKQRVRIFISLIYFIQVIYNCTIYIYFILIFYKIYFIVSYSCNVHLIFRNSRHN